MLKNSKHCFKCNRCTFEFDHHCVWLSNDIGLYNYIDFLRLLLAVITTNILQLAFCTIAISLLSSPSESAASELQLLKILNWLALLQALIMVIFITNLLIFHIFLICTGTSTYKYLKRRQLKAAGKDNRADVDTEHNLSIDGSDKA